MEVSALAWVSDSRLLVGGASGSVQLMERHEGNKLRQVWAAAPAPRRITRFALDGEYVWAEGQSLQRLSLADGHVDATLTPGVHSIEGLAACHQRLLISGTMWENKMPAFSISIWAPKADGGYELQKRFSVPEIPEGFLPLTAPACLVITLDGQGWLLDLDKNSLSPLTLQVTGVPAPPLTARPNTATWNCARKMGDWAARVPRAERFAIDKEAMQKADLTLDQRIEWETRQLQRYIETKHPKLRDLIAMPITDDGLARIEGLAELQYLYLDGTRITDAGLSRLAGAAQLEELSLIGTKITGVGLKHLKGLTRLRRLELANTQDG